MNLDKLIPQKINFNKSISNHQNLLNANILDSNILVIGGAGTIGSSYIKQVLKYLFLKGNGNVKFMMRIKKKLMKI